jgi:hypothetical protein
LFVFGRRLAPVGARFRTCKRRERFVLQAKRDNLSRRAVRSTLASNVSSMTIWMAFIVECYVEFVPHTSVAVRAVP